MAPELRQPVMERTRQIVEHPTSQLTEVCAAAKTFLAASKINLSNIGATIQADKHMELERRMTAIERELDANLGKDPRRSSGA
jgi:hypothetical protein